MPGPLPTRPPTALEYFATLVADDDSLPVLEAAIAIAQHARPGLDVAATLARVDALVARLRARLPPDAPPVHRLRLLNRFFFHELGFAGNVNDYYDPGNSDVDAVVETRRGIPITLALVYVEMATQLGLRATGVSFPGHFLVKVRLPQGEAILDPFTGHSLSVESLREKLLPHRADASDADEPSLAFFLRSATPRETIARLLRNLKEIYRQRHDAAGMLGIAERLVILLPEAWEERRDRGLVHAALGATRAAVLDLTGYLEHAPDAPDRPAIARRLVELGHDGAPRLH